MDHSFSCEIAVEYGLNAAILFKNIAYWCEHNRANEQHFYDGHYWTYNSMKAFRELFPYLTDKQVRSALTKLVDNGLIIKGNYNQHQYDRTIWYAVTDYGWSLLKTATEANCPTGQMQDDKREDCNVTKGKIAIAPQGKSICPTGQNHLPNEANPIAPQGKPIPNINQYKYTDKNTDKSLLLQQDNAEHISEAENPYSDSADTECPDFNTVQAYASNELRAFGTRAMEELNDFVNELSSDIVRHAIDNALDQGIRQWSYVRSILNTYVSEGIKTVGEAKDRDEARRKKIKAKSNIFSREQDAEIHPLSEDDWYF